MSTRGPAVAFDSVGVDFERDGRSVTAVTDVTFEVPTDSFTSIVGPSGCGKSTLLKMVAGILGPSNGHISIDDLDVTGLNDEVGFVTQDSNLFPWLTLRNNIAFPLRVRSRVPRSRMDGLVDEFIVKVGLAGFADHYPHELSGGMQKRAAIARTLVYDPRIILMDEPFGSVDALTRLRLQGELLRLWEQRRKTIVFVTHDLVEAIALSDQVVIMTRHPGRVKAIFDIPLKRPRDPYGIQGNADFATLYDRIWTTFREEVLTDGEP